MHGHGDFSDPRLGVHITQTPDMVTPKLEALRDYQLSLAKPAPPAGSCASCHTGTLFTDVNKGVLHAPEETGMDPRYAARTTQKAYRTTPLRALWQHAPYFHDGSAATLEAVVEHYDGYLTLGLTDQQKRDLVEYLKSI